MVQEKQSGVPWPRPEKGSDKLRGVLEWGRRAQGPGTSKWRPIGQCAMVRTREIELHFVDARKRYEDGY